MTTPSEILRQRLLERDVTVEEVWQYLDLEHKALEGQARQDPQQFVRAQDIANFWWVYDWWQPYPKKPKPLAELLILNLCSKLCYTPGFPFMTFDNALQQFYEKALAHAQTVKPVQSKAVDTGSAAEERNRQATRDRMALARAARKVPSGQINHDPVLAEYIRGLEAQIEQLKDAAAYHDEELRQQVVGYQQKMIERASLRKERASEYKAQIADIRQKIKEATAKQ